MSNKGMAFRVIQVRPDDEWWPQVSRQFPRQIDYMNSAEDGGNYFFFAAVSTDGEFLGGSVIDIGPMRFGPLADSVAGFLEDIEVLRAHRRKGVGSALLLAAVKCAWDSGAQHVRWTVQYANEAGIGLYKSLGFAFVPEEDPSAVEPERYYTVVAVNPAAMKSGYAR